MLAQEIIHGIKKPIIGVNMVIKLDMVKAYYRVCCSFLCLIIRRFGFGEVIIRPIKLSPFLFVIIYGKTNMLLNLITVLHILISLLVEEASCIC